MAVLMYTRRLSALLALPLMAVIMALIGGIPGDSIMQDVIAKGAVKLNVAYTTTMFGAVLAELMNKLGLARALVRWVAEFGGDNPFVLAVVLTAVTALLFSTLGGLGAVIMIGTIILPVMLSLGIPQATAGGLFLFGISLGGMYNLANWQLYVEVLKIDRAQIIGFVLPFSMAIALTILGFLTVELKNMRNIKYLLAGVAMVAAAYFGLQKLWQQEPAAAQAAKVCDPASLQVALVAIILLSAYAAFRHFKKIETTPSLALLTPIVPLVLVLFCRWEIIPAFMVGITYGILLTWRDNSINLLTRAIIDGIASVIPAVVLMMGIGMLVSTMMNPAIADSMAPLMTSIVPTKAISYVVVFTLMAPFALYRGPLSLWGMGSGLVALVQKSTTLSSQAIMGMLMSVGQVQGICDPTNTHNIWIATYLGTDTQVLLKRTIPWAWIAVVCGLVIAVAQGYVSW